MERRCSNKDSSGSVFLRVITSVMAEMRGPWPFTTIPFLSSISYTEYRIHEAPVPFAFALMTVLFNFRDLWKGIQQLKPTLHTSSTDSYRQPWGLYPSPINTSFGSKDDCNIFHASIDCVHLKKHCSKVLVIKPHNNIKLPQALNLAAWNFYEIDCSLNMSYKNLARSQNQGAFYLKGWVTYLLL